MSSTTATSAPVESIALQQLGIPLPGAVTTREANPIASSLQSSTSSTTTTSTTSSTAATSPQRKIWLKMLDFSVNFALAVAGVIMVGMYYMSL